MNDEFELECSTQATYTNRFGFVGCEDGYTQMSCNTWTTSTTLDAYYFKDDRCYIQQDDHRDQYANGICCRLREREPVDDAMSFIFLSDLEYAYRGHFGDKCKNLINWVKDIGSKGYTFDGEFASYSVDADLVIHGGDLSDLRWGVWGAKGTCGNCKGDDASDHLYSNHWQQLYDAGIPMISALGNHDYDPNDPKTAEPNKFVSQSYAKSKDLMGNDFEYKEFKNTHDENGPSLFVSDFEGVQIVNLNYLGNSLEYYDQYYALSDALDDTKTTMFFGHFPITGRAPLTSTSLSRLITLIDRFDGKAKYFCGHNHVRSGPRKFGNSEAYVAAYAHPNWEIGGTGVYHDAGLYAILVSPTKGILQVKNIHIPDSAYGCYSDGTFCLAGTTCGNCCHDARNGMGTICGGKRWSDGTLCGLGTTCGFCKNEIGGTYWWSKAMTACGEEPRWNDGTICVGDACKVCRNKATWWHEKVHMACGTEPKWQDGTVCGLGTSCNQCINKATWWPGKAFTACGSEPCWGKGTVCLTCGQCCGGHKWEWSKFALVCQ